MVLHVSDGEMGPKCFITTWQALTPLERGRHCRSVPDLAPGVRTALKAQQHHLALAGHQAAFQALWGSYHPHFAEKETEAQSEGHRGRADAPRRGPSAPDPCGLGGGFCSLLPTHPTPNPPCPSPPPPVHLAGLGPCQVWAVTAFPPLITSQRS